jgi:hypothetical protein
MADTLWVGPFYEKSYKTGDRAFLVRKCHKTRAAYLITNYATHHRAPISLSNGA